MLLVEYFSPFSSVIVIFQIPTRTNRSLSVPELELPVELPIVFDFCSCLIVIIIFCLFVRLQKYTGYIKVTSHSHWGGIKVARQNQNICWVLGRLNIRRVGVNNPLRRAPMGVLQRGV